MDNFESCLEISEICTSAMYNFLNRQPHMWHVHVVSKSINLNLVPRAFPYIVDPGNEVAINLLVVEC